MCWLTAVGCTCSAIFAADSGTSPDSGAAKDGPTKDSATGATIYNIAGDTEASRRPPAEPLRNVDVVVVDFEETGARLSPLTATLGYFLEAAAQAGKPIVVLDRPNPLNGAYVQGPVSNTGQGGANSQPIRCAMV